jgi:hypothetical protein
VILLVGRPGSVSVFDCSGFVMSGVLGVEIRDDVASRLVQRSVVRGFCFGGRRLVVRLAGCGRVCVWRFRGLGFGRESLLIVCVSWTWLL